MQQPQPTIEQLQSLVNALRQQREAAHDQIAQLAVQLSQTSNELLQAKEQLKELRTS